MTSRLSLALDQASHVRGHSALARNAGSTYLQLKVFPCYLVDERIVRERTEASCLEPLCHALWRTIGSSVVAVASCNPRFKTYITLRSLCVFQRKETVGWDGTRVTCRDDFADWLAFACNIVLRF